MKTLKRRRKEQKTDYHKRIKLLKGNLPRIVFRKTNNYLIAQYVKSDEAKDKVEAGVNSKKLLDYGWPKEFKGSLKSIPAAYLTGFLMGKKISVKTSKKMAPIVDFGMIRSIHKNKVFAFLKGLKDSGIEVKCDEKAFPEEDRIKGKHLKKDFSKHFQEVKSKIEAGK